ncbi:protein-tyrosine-phosphatase [Aliifodinibius salipaludis]|uniref:Protein-tyrosine-phosphatase n=1 Tax=Fodinibius salipaludis TaxID=2032627 RepID=A0A2A2G5S5_9BACT|nr:protein-tyrosine-phosphatase [Aliifodinibius salipaludis]PAU93116.1 protein-tyrosine-phosphatase [Aliifodinibius salipaludis]
MYSELSSYIQNVKRTPAEISEGRIDQLNNIANYIREKGEAKLTFICTHNSRRSHLCQIWAKVMAEYLGVANLETYSGGTEATAFNSRAVAAIKRAGFVVEKPDGNNPRYKIFFDENEKPLICFSKTFDDTYNPQKDFAAIMTCSDADENCPVVPGAEKRFSIPYVDSKESDGTPQEKATYDERCRQIATEMYYLMSQV